MQPEKGNAMKPSQTETNQAKSNPSPNTRNLTHVAELFNYGCAWPRRSWLEVGVGVAVGEPKTDTQDRDGWGGFQGQMEETQSCHLAFMAEYYDYYCWGLYALYGNTFEIINAGNCSLSVMLMA